MTSRSLLIGWVNPRVVSDWLYSDTGVDPEVNPEVDPEVNPEVVTKKCDGLTD